jgi:predicted nucleotide-binding protein
LLQAKTAFKRLSSSVDNNLKLFAEAELNCIALFSGLLKLMFYQLEQKFEKSYNEYLNSVTICRQGFEIARQLNSEDNDENGKKLRIGYLFKIFELFLEGIGMQIQMQIDIKKGKVVSQANILMDAAKCFKRVEELDFVDDPIIIATREMMKRTVETFENSAERIVEEQKTIKFFPSLERKVFIIHGHDEGDLRLLEKMLEETFHLETVVLKDEAGLSESRFCGYAIGLFSPDDIVKNKSNKYFQARPNVFFELGCSAGALAVPEFALLSKNKSSCHPISEAL